jgi:hypothetical protein
MFNRLLGEQLIKWGMNKAPVAMADDDFKKARLDRFFILF